MARIDSLLALLLEQGGSDLHVSAGVPALARVHGDLRALAGQVLSTEAVRALILELLPADAKTTFEAGSEVECSYAMQGGPRFRIHAFLGHRGPAAVIRHVPAAPPELEKLGLPRVAQDICKAQRGLVVVAGPSGSGQSTTLAAMIDEINRTRCQHIVTIEDPIEFVHANKSSFITQRQVRTHCRSTEQAVRAALHEDPDVLLVSAAGDVETIRAALDAAVSGKLVLAGMPTLTARKTVERLIDACQISSTRARAHGDRAAERGSRAPASPTTVRRLGDRPAGFTHRIELAGNTQGRAGQSRGPAFTAQDQRLGRSHSRAAPDPRRERDRHPPDLSFDRRGRHRSRRQSVDPGHGQRELPFVVHDRAPRRPAEVCRREER
jgi:pilus retraction protein PilT